MSVNLFPFPKVCVNLRKTMKPFPGYYLRCEELKEKERHPLIFHRESQAESHIVQEKSEARKPFLGSLEPC